MRIAIVGAGGIGGLLGARLALAGDEVTFMVRGASLAAIRDRGIRLISGGTERVVRDVVATDDYAKAGTHDVVIVATKAHQVGAVAPGIARLLGPDTVVVPVQNGIPYWYFHRLAGRWTDHRIESVDPGGTIAAHLPAERVIGCVVYPAAELVAPGVVKHVEGERFALGELDGSSTDRVTRVSDAFTRAGFKAPILDDIRAEIWLKLWGNLVFNPVSALSRATLADICAYPPTRALAAAMMSEAQAVAAKLGVTFRVSIERRIDGAAGLGHHKTSMLQDIEAGRELEIDALLGSVLELARLVDVAAPHLETVYALAKLLGKPAAPAR